MAQQADGSASLAQLLAEYAETEKELSDPAVHADAAVARRLGRRFAQLAPINNLANELAAAQGDLAVAQELGADRGLGQSQSQGQGKGQGQS